jgi:bacteriophage N4 adsorption protein B
MARNYLVSIITLATLETMRANVGRTSWERTTMSIAITAFTVLVLCLYIAASLDDVWLDLVYLFRYHRVRARDVAPSNIEIEAGRIAIMIPAWQESGVVVPMIESTLELAHYPNNRLEFFVGVYPNDLATLSEVQALAARRKNVHCVVNSKPGPTNKSQNLNEVYAYIKGQEILKDKVFHAIAVHDAEDVIHPYTFKLYNSLLTQHAVVQLPVFAIFPKTNFWGRVISGTYADEFAEHHLHHMPVREHLGMFVPSAGTGFAIRRDVAERLTAKDSLFREGSLTEDYEFALRLWQIGCKVHFHVQELERVDDEGIIKREYVAVREYFPSEWTASIKQKGRWIYGITLQTPKFIDWKKLNFKDKWTLIHDQKGKITNLIHLLGYPLALYAVLSLVLPLPAVSSPLVYTLSLIVTLMTGFRLAMRFTAVRSIYGHEEALLSTFAPPLLRWFVATTINTFATVRAWRLYFFPNGITKAKNPQKGTTPKWDKTERKGYVSQDILSATKRRLGDNLLFYNDVEPEELLRVIREKEQGKRMGDILRERSMVPRNKVNRRIAELHKIKPLQVE